MTKKKIVIDCRESGTSTGRYIDKLVEYLYRLQPEHDITLLVKPHRLDFMRSIAPGFSREACPHREFTFAEQLALKKQIERLKPDLVHFPAVQQPVLYKGTVVTTMQDLTTVRFRNPAKNPVIFLAKQQVYKWVNKRVARKSKLLITPSEYVRQDVAVYCHVNPAKITVTLESSDDMPMPAEPVAGLEGERFIMYVGRPTPHKNLPRLVQAFAELRASRPDLRLVFVGKTDSNYQALEDDVKRQGIDGVTFTGFVSDNQLRWLYERCAAYVFPSLSEGFGLPSLEAMRHGAPVVSSNATCLPEVNGDAAHYFNPLDAHDMAVKIGEVIDDPALRAQLVARNPAQIAKYSWRRMAQQTLEVYQRALDG